MKQPFIFGEITWNHGTTYGLISGSFEDCKDFLEELKVEAKSAISEEENLRIWDELREIARDLENGSVMKLPYAKKYYPILIALCNQIREVLKHNLGNSPNKPKSWRLFRCE